jgi:hypothetical protein
MGGSGPNREAPENEVKGNDDDDGQELLLLER